jgi:hypothetical protein
MTNQEKSPPASPPALVLAEVRYSLPDLLREVEAERNAPAFAMEKLDQVEITKLFTKGKSRRALKSRN